MQFVVAGGLLRPIEGGTYVVNEQMVLDFKERLCWPACFQFRRYYCMIRLHLGLNIPAFIVDPVVVDELQPIARVSGMHQRFERKSLFHALNQKAVARKTVAISQKNAMKS